MASSLLLSFLLFLARQVPSCLAVRLLQETSSDSPSGTLVAIWELVPAKTDGGQFWGTPRSTYAWSSTNPPYAYQSGLVYYLERAYFVGENGQETDLILTGGCDLTRISYPDTQAIYNACKGTAIFAADATISQLWSVHKGSGHVLHIQEPFDHIEITTALFGNIQPQSGAYLGTEIDGTPVPSQGSLPSSVSNLIASANIGPYTHATGELSLSTITLKIRYTPTTAIKGTTISWGSPYTSAQVFGVSAPPVISDTLADVSSPPRSTPVVTPTPPPTGAVQTPPQGTLVAVWELVPAKTAGGSAPPSKYAWVSSYPDQIWLVYYLERAYYVAGNDEEVDLTLKGGCDVATTSYSDYSALYNSCKGTATFPSDVSITQYWSIHKSAGQVLSIREPFDQIEISSALFGNVIPQSGAYLGAEMDGRPASFPPNAEGPNVGSQIALIGSARIGPYSQAQGELRFSTVTIKAAYPPTVAIKGSTLTWMIPYTAAYVKGLDGQPPVLSNAPKESATSTSTTTPTPKPRGVRMVGPTVDCPPVDGSYTNSCFNTGGTHHVCCVNPDSCGPFTQDGEPTCTNGNYYYFPQQ